MRMRALVVLGVFVASHAATAERVRPPQTPIADALILHFPRTLDTTSLEIRYMAYGHGAFGGFVRGETGIWDYRIPATIRPMEFAPGEADWMSKIEPHPATSLKGIVTAPGYSVFLIDLPSIEQPAREMTVDLRRLLSVTVQGRVVLPAGGLAAPVVVEAAYSPTWECEFYGLMDCMVGIRRVGRSGNLGKDGMFSLQIPDIAHDPALARFGDRGDFSFRLADPLTSNTQYRLARAPGLDPMRAPYRVTAWDASAAPLVLYPYPPG